MNVAFDAWIPVVTTAGKRQLASLCTVLAEGAQFADLAVRPHERVALMRLLLCVAHAALDGPQDYDEWCEVPARLPEATRKYLGEWRAAFKLFDPEKPWLQVAGLSKVAGEQKAPDDTSGWTPTSKLTFSFATGNKTTLFDHRGMAETRPVAFPDLILSVLTYQCFSTGGLISQAYWDGKQTTKSSKDAPCVTASMVHALLRGRDLFESIHLNLPTHEDIRFSYGQRGIGRPIWEQPPRSLSDKPNIENATETYAGRLVPMSRFIRLHSDGALMLLGDGLVYPTFTDGFPPEPTATVVVRRIAKKEERAVLSYRPSRALWRELGAVIVKRRAGGTGGPLSLRAIQDGRGCDLVVGALARDQADIVDTAESVFRVPPRLSSPEGVSAYESEVNSADEIASRLGWSVEGYRSAIDGGWEGRLKGAGPSKGELKAKLHGVATTNYWTTVEKNLPLLMAHVEAIGTDKSLRTRDAWRKKLFAAACDAYRTACGQETPRQIRAFAEGWKRLVSRKDETEPSGKEGGA
ncbi:MAG: type I-E CRISPR-associated protein Cse1/CasA [Thermoguttaceae bacterium]|jgi:CRISPR system Cascade subunit CasA